MVEVRMGGDYEGWSGAEVFDESKDSFRLVPRINDNGLFLGLENVAVRL